MSEPPIELPRWQAGNNPQHLLVTMLAEYWAGRDEFLPSAALVVMLTDLDVTEDSARAALSRLARRGVLEVERRGRHTFYRFGEAVSGDPLEGGAELLSPVAENPDHGVWMLCAYSLPESETEMRKRARVRLRAMGFVPIYDGLWASPQLDHARVNRALDEVGLERASVFTATEHLGALRPSISEAWGLEGLRDEYVAFLEEWKRTPDELAHGRISPREAFIYRTAMLDTFRSLSARSAAVMATKVDPSFPHEQARSLTIQCHRDLAPLAELRVRDIVRHTDADLAERVHAHGPEVIGAGRDGLAACAKCASSSP